MKKRICAGLLISVFSLSFTISTVAASTTQSVPVTAEIPEESHTCKADSGEKIIDKEPTCTSTGKYHTIYRCVECREEMYQTDGIIKALGHAWSDDWTFYCTLTSNPPVDFLKKAENCSGSITYTVGDSLYVRYCTRSHDAYEIKVVAKKAEETPSAPTKPEEPSKPDTKPSKPEEPTKPDTKPSKPDTKPSNPDTKPSTPSIPTETVTETKTAIVHGTILDSSSNPIPNAKVDLKSDAIEKVAITDYKGEFEIADVPCGDYNLYVSLKGSSIATVKINVTDDKSSAQVLDRDNTYTVSTLATPLNIQLDVTGKKGGDSTPSTPSSPSPKTGQDSSASSLGFIGLLCFLLSFCIYKLKNSSKQTD